MSEKHRDSDENVFTPSQPMDEDTQRALDEAMEGIDLGEVIGGEEAIIEEMSDEGTLQGRVVGLHKENIFIELPGAEQGVLPVYQAGPMNTTGQVKNEKLIRDCARDAAEKNNAVILDRAYSGFEFAHLLKVRSYDDIMRMSYELQVKPFIEEKAPFCLALSPTKSFLTFALRPCGMLLIYSPDEERQAEVTGALNAVMRARGSAFEHPVTRAFVKAMIKDRARLEEEHILALGRLADARALWGKLAEGTPIEYLFSDEYAGLFRNPKAKEDAAVHIYNEHIYPVLSKGRCRINVTGIPIDEAVAKKLADVFAENVWGQPL